VAKAVGGDKGVEPREPAANGAEGQAPTQHQQPPAAPEPEPFFRTSARDAAINQRRFGIAYLVLAIAVGVAVGLGIVLVGRGGSSSSARGPGGFAPRQQGELGAREIANQVTHEYKGEAGDDFVAVVGQRPSIQNVAIHDDLIRPSDTQSPKDTVALPIGNGIMFLMCGGGANCTITSSSPATVDRTLLVEQEALELTLRTFKNDSDVQTVTVLMPPASTQPNSGHDLVSVANRTWFTPLIHRPLSATIPRRGPYAEGDIGPTTARAIRNYLQPQMYMYRADSLPDGTPTLILDPYPHGA
jgi:hypothetical protein